MLSACACSRSSVRLNASATSPSPRFHSPDGVLLDALIGATSFDLVPRPEPLLVDQLVLDRALAAAGHGRRPDRFVLGKRLLGEERARQVQVAARPRRIGAERADMADRERDVLWRQRVAERRHVAIEAADRAALMDDGVPVRVGFAGRKRAVAEVGKGRVEADDRRAGSPAIRAVAGGTGRAVHVLAGPLDRRSARRRWCLRLARLRPTAS